MRKILQYAICFAVLSGAGHCDSKSLIENLGQRAIATLTNSTEPTGKIEDQFVKLLDEGFDVPKIAQFVMGRYWRQASGEQQQKFIKLFTIRLKRAYANRFREYKGVKFVVGGVNSRDGSDYVKSTIQKPGGPKTDVEWRVENGKIQDVIVEGVSMSVTLRDDYNSLLGQKNGNIAAFLTVLEEKN